MHASSGSRLCCRVARGWRNGIAALGFHHCIAAWRVHVLFSLGGLMGFSLNGSCYQDSPAALLAWKNQFPTADAGVIVQLNSSSATAGGLLSYATTATDLTSNASKTNAGTVQMRACDYNDVTLGQDYGFSVFIGCSLMFALGFIGTR